MIDVWLPWLSKVPKEVGVTSACLQKGLRILSGSAHPNARRILLPKRCCDKLLQCPPLVLCQRLGGEQQQGTGVAILGEHLLAQIGNDRARTSQQSLMGRSLAAETSVVVAGMSGARHSSCVLLAGRKFCPRTVSGMACHGSCGHVHKCASKTGL